MKAALRTSFPVPKYIHLGMQSNASTFLKAPRMEKLNLIKNDTAHRSLTPMHVLGRWPRASMAHFHYSLNVEKIFAKSKGKKDIIFCIH